MHLHACLGRGFIWTRGRVYLKMLVRPLKWVSIDDCTDEHQFARWHLWKGSSVALMGESSIIPELSRLGLIYDPATYMDTDVACTPDWYKPYCFNIKSMILNKSLRVLDTNHREHWYLPDWPETHVWSPSKWVALILGQKVTELTSAPHEGIYYSVLNMHAE